MRTHRIAALLAVGGAACAAGAQPALEIRFSNCTNVTPPPPPNSSVPVRLGAFGLPNVGTPIPWTTPPGTGQVGTYQGFRGVLTNINGTGGTWWPTAASSIAPPFVGPPFGNPGIAMGSNVTGINISVGLNPPVTGDSLLLWTGTIEVGFVGVNLATTIQPIGNPPQTGFEVALDVGLGYHVSHFLPTANSSAFIMSNTPPPPWRPPCYADCNLDSVLNLADFGCFQTRYALGHMCADCNLDSVLNLGDFGCFQTRFAQGCP